jgi:7-cyano-7-deazaguanine synthase in queuosine biosynthesis
VTSKLACDVKWRTAEPQRIAFIPGKEISLHLARGASLGGELSPIAADLLDVAAAVFWIERRLLRRRESPTEFHLRMPVREPKAWKADVVGSLERLLQFMGNARWTIELTARRGNRNLPAHDATARPFDAVSLFSGGLDSFCGAATSSGQSVRLVSYYSRQRRKQNQLADALGHAPPVQWRIVRARVREPGRSFRYRSLLFLCLGAATASACGARTILQCENGVLASAIPPSPAWLMTKHAHPRVHSLASELFSGLFGEPFVVENPFLLHTKRQCCDLAKKEAGIAKFESLARETETCWHFWSNRLPGARPESDKKPKKSPGEHCGVCIPCIVRRTALDDTSRSVAARAQPYACDITRAKWQNHPRFGRDYRAYYGFVDVVGATGSLTQFYRVLPAPGRQLFTDNAITAQDLYKLLHAFADEFKETFR